MQVTEEEREASETSVSNVRTPQPRCILEKYLLHVETVEFMGYIVGKEGVTLTEKKVGRIHT